MEIYNIPGFPSWLSSTIWKQEALIWTPLYPTKSSVEHTQLLLCPFDDQGFLLLRYLHAPVSNESHDLSRGSWCEKGAVDQWTCCFQCRQLRSEVKIMGTTCVSHFIRLKEGYIPTWISLWNTHQCHLSSDHIDSYSSFIFSCSNFLKKHEFLEWFWDTIFFGNQKSRGFHYGPTTKPRANHGMHGIAPTACVFANSPRTSRSCLWATKHW